MRRGSEMMNLTPTSTTVRCANCGNRRVDPTVCDVTPAVCQQCRNEIERYPVTTPFNIL